MKVFVFFAFAIATAYGWVDWWDLQVGNGNLPVSLADAKAEGWKLASRDKNLKVSWYLQSNDPRFQLAFDAHNNIAGLRLNVLKTAVDKSYAGVYSSSGVFDETTIGGKHCYTSTVLFSDEDILKSGGRRKQDLDEVALGLFLKKGDVYDQVDREGCEHAKTGVKEQGCQSWYGMVFSDFDSDSNCGSLSPFYTIWDTNGRGNLIGFGWLTFGGNQPHSKVISKSSLKALFPNHPECLTLAASKGLRTVEVWLAKHATKSLTCENTGDSWFSSHCQSKGRNFFVSL